MRICSFLPSATEILYALGLGDSVHGVTFECDYPPEAAGKPIVVNTLLPHGLSQEEIDREVSRYAALGESLYRVDIARLQAIQPELIVTQELCDVCAVDGSHLARALHQLSPQPRVVTLTPHTLDEVLQDIERVGDAACRAAEARALVLSLRARIDKIRAAPKPQQPRVACLEWLTPPFNGGHWIPEMVALAGGTDPLGARGGYSTRMTWQQLLDAQPEVILVMPCGYNAAQAAEEYRRAELPPGWRDLPAVQSGRVYAVDATSHFSRPGPASSKASKSCTPSSKMRSRTRSRMESRMAPPPTCPRAAGSPSNPPCPHTPSRPPLPPPSTLEPAPKSPFC